MEEPLHGAQGQHKGEQRAGAHRRLRKQSTPATYLRGRLPLPNEITGRARLRGVLPELRNVTAGRLPPNLAADDDAGLDGAYGKSSSSDTSLSFRLLDLGGGARSDRWRGGGPTAGGGGGAAGSDSSIMRCRMRSLTASAISASFWSNTRFSSAASFPMSDVAPLYVVALSNMACMSRMKLPQFAYCNTEQPHIHRHSRAQK